MSEGGAKTMVAINEQTIKHGRVHCEYPCFGLSSQSYYPTNKYSETELNEILE